MRGLYRIKGYYSSYDSCSFLGIEVVVTKIHLFLLCSVPGSAYFHRGCYTG